MTSLSQACDSPAEPEDEDPLESLGRHVLKIYGPQTVTSEDSAALRAIEAADYRRKEELAAQRSYENQQKIEELKRKLANTEVDGKTNTEVDGKDDGVQSSASRSNGSDCKADTAAAGQGGNEAVLKQVEIENTRRLATEAAKRENEAAEQIKRLQEQLAAAMKKAELGAAD